MLNGSTLLVTGGTGSLGNAIVAHLLASPDCPDRLIVLSRDEQKQHDMRQRFPDPRLRFFIGDVRDRDRLYRAFDGVDFIIHAAALKIVPAGEYNPEEPIKTNTLGAMNVIDAAIDRNVQRVMQVSTDKAVNPVNLYGASKLCAEKLMVAANAYAGGHRTRFACVRYGNVANSRGSVIPIWSVHAENCWDGCLSDKGYHERVCSGISLTDERMTRFWITLPQAVDFVLASLERMQGEEVFVPKLPSVKMTDVAKAVAPDCRVTVSGIRPGEKIAESLIGADELREDHGDHYVVGRGQSGPAYDSATNPEWLTVEAIRRALSPL